MLRDRNKLLRDINFGRYNSVRSAVGGSHGIVPFSRSKYNISARELDPRLKDGY